jgi:hypothetical protein
MRFALLALALLGGTVEAPPFTASVSRVTTRELQHSWRPGCPVGPSQLRRVRLRHWGFDGKPHTGSAVVNAAVVGDIKVVFRRLYNARFPIRRLRPIDVYGGNDERSMAADNTSAFNCRYAIATGPRRWSAHAYGTAIDVNPLENPYVLGAKVRPPAGAAYLDRTRARPGMAVRDGLLVRPFSDVGWGWGGRWAASPDYQHFSAGGG